MRSPARSLGPAAVERRDPVLQDPGAVRQRRVAGVVLPVVERVAAGEPVHEPVPDHLRHDRRRRDRGALLVAHGNALFIDEILFSLAPCGESFILTYSSNLVFVVFI